jgi:hypothetical protein
VSGEPVARFLVITKIDQCSFLQRERSEERWRFSRFDPIYIPQYLTLNVFDVFLNKLILRVFLPDDGHLEVRHCISIRHLR